MFLIYATVCWLIRLKATLNVNMETSNLQHIIFNTHRVAAVEYYRDKKYFQLKLLQQSITYDDMDRRFIINECSLRHR